MLGNLEKYNFGKLCCLYYSGIKTAGCHKSGHEKREKGTFGQIVWQYMSQSLVLSFFNIFLKGTDPLKRVKDNHQKTVKSFLFNIFHKSFVNNCQNANYFRTKLL